MKPPLLPRPRRFHRGFDRPFQRVPITRRRSFSRRTHRLLRLVPTFVSPASFGASAEVVDSTLVTMTSRGCRGGTPQARARRLLSPRTPARPTPSQRAPRPCTARYPNARVGSRTEEAVVAGKNVVAVEREPRGGERVVAAQNARRRADFQNSEGLRNAFGRGFGFDPKAHRGCVARVRCLQNGRARARRVEPDGDVQGREREPSALDDKNFGFGGVQRRRPRAKRPTDAPDARSALVPTTTSAQCTWSLNASEARTSGFWSELTTATSTSAMVALSSRTPRRNSPESASKSPPGCPDAAGLDEQPVGLGSAQHLGHRDGERRGDRAAQAPTRHLAHDHSAVPASGGGGSRDVRVGDARGGVQHSSVDAERAELVHHDRPLLVRGALRQQVPDRGGLAHPKHARDDVHGDHRDCGPPPRASR